MHDVYSKFCQKIFGGYIDRKYLVNSDGSFYDLYKHTIDKLEEYSSLLCPYKDLWPDYNVSCYYSDCFSTWYVNPEMVQKFVESIESQCMGSNKDSKSYKAKFKDISRKLLLKFCISSQESDTGDIRFAETKIDLPNSPSLSVESLFTQIMETLLKLELFPIRVQTKLLVDKEVAQSYLTEYAKFIVLAIKEPAKSFPSHVVELVWQIHAEFTDVYRNFCDVFFGKFKQLPDTEREELPKMQRRYEFTKAEYQRVFLTTPNALVWESEERRFEANYTRKVFVNINKLWLTHLLRIKTPEYLHIPKEEALKSNKDMPTMIQIYNNREKRHANYKKGKLYQWRKFYPNNKECFNTMPNLDFFEATKTSASIIETDSGAFIPDFFSKKGGLVFIGDPFDPKYMNAKNLSMALLKGMYENVTKHNVFDLTLEDIADASRSINLI